MSTEPKKCCEDFHARGGSVIECSCLPNSPCHTPTVEDGRSKRVMTVLGDIGVEDHIPAILRVVHNEVSLALSTQREDIVAELLGEIEKLKKPMLDKDNPDNYEACFARHGFNDALEKLKDIINSFKGEV